MVLCPFDFFSDKITCGECELIDRCAAHRELPYEATPSIIENTFPDGEVG